MKKQLLIFFLLLFTISNYAQNFEKQWSKIDKLEAEGSFKLAYDDVLNIEKKAIKKNNQQELIKVFLFKSKYSNFLFDKNANDLFDEINQQIEKADDQSIHFYNYIKAVFLIENYKKKDYYFSNKPNLLNEKSNANFKDWGKTDYINTISELFTATFSNSNKLKKTPIVNFKELIISSENTKQENLYEFFLEKWMLLNIGELYRNSVISNYEVYRNFSDSFLNIDLSKNDDVSLRAFQMLENYYKQIKNINEYDRTKYLRYFQNNASEDFKILNQLIKNTKSNEIKNKYRIMRLKQLIINSSENNNTLYLQQAIKLIDSLKNENLVVSDLTQIEYLEEQIKAKRLIVYNEPSLYDNQHSKIFVEFKNIDTLYSFIYKVEDYDTFSQLKSDSLYFNYIKDQKPVEFFATALPNQADFNDYTTEVLMPDFSEGYYFIVSSYEKKISLQTSSVRFNPFVVSDVFVVVKNSYNLLELQLLNRKTGKPFNRMKVFVLGKYYFSDEKGIVKIAVDNNSFDYAAKVKILVYTENFIYVEEILGNEFSFLKWNYNDINEEDEIKLQAFIYIDRGIYRPGQDVYFKAIIFKVLGNEKQKVIDNLKIDVEFKESRSETIEKISLITNEFGSVEGKFTIPNNVNEGQFLINLSKPENLTKSESKFWDKADLDFNYVSFEVAEYKRSTFDVTLNKFEENLEIGKTIYISGSVKSLANAPIANAKVQIDTKADYPNVQDQSKQNFPIDDVFTDANGNFEFPFTLKKDWFSTEVFENQIDLYFSIEVIDNSGEVREAEMKLVYSKDPFKIEYVQHYETLLEETETDKIKVDIKTTNLNGKFISTKGKIQVFKFRDEEIFHIDTKWTKPSIEIIDSLVLVEKFPYQQYVNEFKEFQKELVLEKDYITQKDEKLILDKKQFSSGQYFLKFIPNDSLLANPNKQFNFQVFDYYFTNFVSINIDDEKSLKTKKLHLKIINKGPAIYFNLDLGYLGNENKSFSFHLNKGENTIELPISIKDRNIAFFSNFYFVYDNKFFISGERNLYFPYEKKNSLIKTEIIHLTDKLNPGDDYNWKLKIFNQNKTNDKIEVLATMYDFSLDAINSERWDDFYFYNNNYINSVPKIIFNESTFLNQIRFTFLITWLY